MRLPSIATVNTLAVTLVALVVGSACDMHNKENLIDAMRAYNDAIRWRMPEMAGKYLRGKARAHFVNTIERREDVRVTHYQISRVKLVGSKKAQVVVRFNWYSELRGRVHRTVMTQHWSRKGSNWHVSDQRWVRGPTLPLLAAASDARPAKKTGRPRSSPRRLTPPRNTP